MRRPAEVFAPGAFILEEMRARGWTWAELGRGAEPRLVAAMINAALLHDLIDEWVAGGLARAFGTSAQLWLDLDAAYRAEKRAREASE